MFKANLGLTMILMNSFKIKSIFMKVKSKSVHKKKKDEQIHHIVNSLYPINCSYYRGLP